MGTTLRPFQESKPVAYPETIKLGVLILLRRSSYCFRSGLNHFFLLLHMQVFLLLSDSSLTEHGF